MQQFIESQKDINEKLIENCWMIMTKKPWKIRYVLEKDVF